MKYKKTYTTLPLHPKLRERLKPIAATYSDRLLMPVYRVNEDGIRILIISDKVMDDGLKEERLFSEKDETVLDKLICRAYSERHTKEPLESIICVNWEAARPELQNYSNPNNEDRRRIGECNTFFWARIKFAIKKFAPDVVICAGLGPFTYMYRELISDDPKHVIRNRFNRVLKAELNEHKFKLVGTVDLGRPCSWDVQHKSYANMLGYLSYGISQAMDRKNWYNVRLPKPKIINVNTIEKFDKFYNRLLTEEFAAIDTEGSGEGRLTSKLFCMQVAFEENKGYFLPLYHPDSPFTPKELKYISKKLQYYFEFEKIKKYHIYQNGKYDVGQYMAQLNVRYYNHRVYDIMGGAWLENQNLAGLKNYGFKSSFGLDIIAAQLGCHIYEEIEFSKGDRNRIASEGFTPRLIEYAIYDATVMVAIHNCQIQRARDRGHSRFVLYNAEQISDTLLCLAQIENTGALMDKRQMYLLHSKDGPINTSIQKDLDAFKESPAAQKVNKWLIHKEGLPSSGMLGKRQWVFNINKQLDQKVLYFDVLKIKPLAFKKDGNGKVDKAFLKEYSGKYPDVKTLQQYKGACTLRNNFVNKIFKMSHSDRDFLHDGRLRSRYTYTKTTTGRLCLDGNSMISVLDSRCLVPIKDIRPGDYVWSFDDKLNPVVNKVKWQGKTKYAETVTIMYQGSGFGASLQTLICTPDHPVRLRDGSYKKAKDLKPKDRVLHLERKYLNKGYRSVNFTGMEDKKHLWGGTNKCWEHRLATNCDEGLLPHHKDEIRDNNVPSNLEIMEPLSHYKYHGANKSEEQKKSISKTLRRKYASGEIQVERKYGKDNPRYVEISRHNLLNALKKSSWRPTLAAKLLGVDYSVIMDRMKKYEIDLETQRQRYNGDNEFITDAMLKKASKMSSYVKAGKYLKVNYYKAKSLLESDYNHEIVKVVNNVGKRWTYDIEVEKDHNFIANGICVHNSSVDPNLQNLVARGDWAEHLKLAWIAARRCCIPKGDFCLTGDTLVNTEKGLIRIDSLGTHDKNVDYKASKNINIAVGGLNKPVKAVKWLYNGHRDTLRLETKTGNIVKCTYDHEVLVLDTNKGILSWREAQDCKIGDLLCINPTQATRKEALNLNLTEAKMLYHTNTTGATCVYKEKRAKKDSWYSRIKVKGKYKFLGTFNSYDEALSARQLALMRYGLTTNEAFVNLKQPTHMTPELSYVIGCLVAEGSVQEGKKYNQISVSNNDKALLREYARCLKKVFGISSILELKMKKGTKIVINGVLTQTNHDHWVIRTTNNQLALWFKELGVYTQKTVLKKGKKASHYKCIPWSILQADKESQLAFIAAYLECDGNINNNQSRLSWYSTSKRLIKQLTVLLNSFGFVASKGRNATAYNVTTFKQSSQKLWQQIKKYMVTKTLKEASCRDRHGVPLQGLFTASVYSKNKSLCYTRFNNNYLDKLKAKNVDVYNKLKELIKLGYFYTPVTCISDNGVQPVYDLTIEKGEQPAFIANGLVVHNSANEVRDWCNQANDNVLKESFYVGLKLRQELQILILENPDEWTAWLKFQKNKKWFDKDDKKKDHKSHWTVEFERSGKSEYDQRIELLKSINNLTTKEIGCVSFEIDMKADVHKNNCLIGSTLVITEKGIKTIKSLENCVGTSVSGRYKKEKIVNWIDSGRQKVLNITNSLGSSIECTEEHEILILNKTTGETEWKKAGNCNEGDLLCINTKPLTRKTPLKLNLLDAIYTHVNNKSGTTGVYYNKQKNKYSVSMRIKGKNKEFGTYKTFEEAVKYRKELEICHNTPSNRGINKVTKPLYMTPDLAFIVGCLVAEGCVRIEKNGSYINFANSNKKLLKLYEEKIEKIFGIKINRRLLRKKGDFYRINGITGTNKVDTYDSSFCSKNVACWLNELGLALNNKNGSKPTSWLKVIPWSILEADEQSQLAFIAAYIECDGSINKNSISIHSRSRKLIKQFQVMLLSHGFISTHRRDKTCRSLHVRVSDSLQLYVKCKKYMVTKKVNLSDSISKSGMPVEFILQVLKERYVSRNVYLNDKGHKTTLKDFSNYLQNSKSKILCYDSQFRNIDKYLNHIKEISVDLHNKIQCLTKEKYYFASIKSIREIEKFKKVYDISIEPGKEPSFTANGVIVHNCVAMFGLNSPLDVTPDQRYDIKAIVFGKIYGKIAKSFAKPVSEGGLGKSEEECDAIMSKFEETFTEGTAWLQRENKLGLKLGYVESPQGFRRYLDGYTHTRTAVINAMHRRGPNCVDEKTECLTKNGWKPYKYLSVGDLIYTKNVKTGRLELQPINKLTVSKYKGNMWRLDGAIDALVTPNHKWLIDSTHGRKKVKYQELVDSAYLASSGNNNPIHLTADKPIKQTGDGTWSNNEVKLLGWILTDGCYAIGRDKRISLAQSERGNPHKVENIDSIFKSLRVKHSRRGPDSLGLIRWKFNGFLAQKIREAIPRKIMSPEFLQTLSTKQLQLLYDHMMLGNGNINRKTNTYIDFGAGTKEKADMFSMLCTLLGVSHNMRAIKPTIAIKQYDSMPNIPQQTQDFWVVYIKRRHRAQAMFYSSWVKYNGKVWCPTVKNGTFIARRNNTVYVTGNSKVQGTSANICTTSIRNLQKLFWNLFTKQNTDSYWKAITNTVHDAIEGETPISFLPVYLYMFYHATTTLMHRRFNKTFGYKFHVGLESEINIGPTLAHCKDAWAFDWDTLLVAINKTIQYQNEKLGYNYSKKEIKEMIDIAKHNWDITSQLRLAELKHSVKSDKAITMMLLTEENALDIGLIIEGHEHKPKKYGSTKNVAKYIEEAA